MISLELFIGFIIFEVFSISCVYFVYMRWQKRYKRLLSQKKSSEVRVGLIAEQLVPFLNGFKYNPKLIKFLGQPVDYVYYGPDKIVFIEVKTGKSRLSDKQKQIKQLIEEGKVEFEIFRISGEPPKQLDENKQPS